LRRTVKATNDDNSPINGTTEEKEERMGLKKWDERVKSRECAEEVGYLGVGMLRGSERELLRARAEKGLCL
jgi:hypothetical protein